MIQQLFEYHVNCFDIDVVWVKTGQFSQGEFNAERVVEARNISFKINVVVLVLSRYVFTIIIIVICKKHNDKDWNPIEPFGLGIKPKNAEKPFDSPYGWILSKYVSSWGRHADSFVTKILYRNTIEHPNLGCMRLYLILVYINNIVNMKYYI